MPHSGSISSTKLPNSPIAVPTGGLARETVRTLALAAGFTEAGIVALPHPETARDAARFTEFVEDGHAGSMDYLARRDPPGDPAGELVRSRIHVPFPWARSVVVVMASYHAQAPLSIAPASPAAAWIARYAWSSKTETATGATRPSDYHKVLLKRLRALETAMHTAFGEFESRAYVDTGPVVERSIAQAAALGWTGKNTCLIHPKHGSWNFLGVLVTSLPVQADASPLLVPDRCGTCRRCLDACPTGALFEPYKMNATLCISYLTIEHKGDISDELRSGMGRQIFGCDICQDVCPWNRKAPIARDAELTPRPELINPTLDWLAALEEADFERIFNGSPVRRAGFDALRRNIAIAMGNSRLQRFRPILVRWADPQEYVPEPLQKAARWALHRISLE